MTSRKSKTFKIITIRQEQLISEIRRTVQKRDAIMLKYNWKREDREDLLTLPKINSRLKKKKPNSTQVERQIASLKFNISKTNQSLENLDRRIDDKTNNFKSLDQNLKISIKNLILKEKQIDKKKEELVENKINKAILLFQVSLSQKLSKELSKYRQNCLKKGKLKIKIISRTFY
jgi:hypothetical protein